MTQPRFLKPSLFAMFALAVIAAGCAGGAGGPRNALPSAPGAPVDDAARHRHRVNATMSVYIPRKPRHHERGENYVSPFTQSFTVGVQAVTSSPWPSLPTQTLVVATPKPCVAATGGGYVCKFQVRVYEGNDVFTFAEYASQTPSPSNTPLATLTTGVTNTSGALDFALEGVVNKVVLTVPRAESTHDPVSGNTQAIPIGAATSFPLRVVPYDPAGAQIATDTFAAPITLTLAPATSGVSLSLVKKCAGDTASATKLTLNCAADLTQVTVKYDGTVTPASGLSYVDAAAIVASPEPTIGVPPRRAHFPVLGGTPVPAMIALSSNVLSYELMTPVPGVQPPAYSDVTNLALDPTSGKLVAGAVLDNQTLPLLVEFDPTSPATSAASRNLTFEPYDVDVDSLGRIWTNDLTSSALHCFSTLTSPPSTVGVTSVFGGFKTPMLTHDGSGNIWYAGDDVNGNAAAGFFASTCANTSNTAQYIFASSLSVYGIAPAAPSAGHSGIWTLAGSNLYPMNTATNATPTPAATFPVGQYPESFVNDQAFNLYTFVTVGASSAIDKFTAGSIQSLVTLQPSAFAYGIAQYSGTSSVAQALLLPDDTYGSAILVSPVSSKTEPLLIPLAGAFGCSSANFDKAGNPWVVCGQFDGSVWAYRPIVTTSWAAFPSQLPYYGSPNPAVIGIAEASGTDSSPFTVTANTNPSVLSVNSPWTSYPHSIPVEINAVGATTLTITDANGRSQQLTVAVVAEESPDLRHRHRRHH